MGTDQSVLQKVRALLAKAEATPFDAEAEAFTAKAQELITRHRIDRALVASENAGSYDAPGKRSIDIDDPYVKPKIVLLSNIAAANECRAVWPAPLRKVELFGFADDLDAVEELFTSLLVQATAAMRRAGPKADAFGRSRTRSFRNAFLLSFAVRIGQRLRETADATVGAAVAGTGTALVPLLAARSEAVDALTQESFPALRPVRATVSDAEGWHAGATFADTADLSIRRAVDQRARR